MTTAYQVVCAATGVPHPEVEPEPWMGLACLRAIRLGLDPATWRVVPVVAEVDRD